MTPPIHCNHKCRPYFVKYGHPKRPHSIEWGFRCVVCGQFRIPTGEPIDPSYMNGLDAVREAAIEFWRGIDFDVAFPALIAKRKGRKITDAFQ